MTKTTLVIGIAAAAVAIAALCLFFLGGAGGASGEGSEKLTAPDDTVRYIVKIDGEIAYDEKSPMHDGAFQVITYVPSWSGRAFTGWNDKEDGTGKSYRSGETVILLDVQNKGIVLYAKWGYDGSGDGNGGDGNGNGGGGGGGGGQASAYTVAFDSQGGSAVASITDVDEGSRISEPRPPERPGYAFWGWHKDAACVNAWDFAEDTVYGDITLYAQWSNPF